LLSITVQKRRYLFDCLTVCVTHEVAVNLKVCSRIGVTELPECGTNDEVLAYHGLDVPGLVKQFRAALETVPQVA